MVNIINSKGNKNSMSGLAKVVILIALTLSFQAFAKDWSGTNNNKDKYTVVNKTQTSTAEPHYEKKCHTEYVDRKGGTRNRPVRVCEQILIGYW